jgi:PST family polysaccharide transporter
MYNLAYNLADVPAIHVGEQVGDVLLPSFARMGAEHRPAALARSVTLLALVVFPLAIGLGAVAPTVVAALFDPHWQPIGPMLVILSALSVARPIGWTIASYLQARHLPGLILALEVLKLAIMMLFIVTLGSRSPAWTCVCVGIAFGAHAVASLLIVQRLDGMPVAPLLLSLARVLVACGPMVAAVLGMRFLLNRVAPMPAAIELIIETIVGILVYPPCALLLCGVSARDLVRRVVDAVRPATR